MRSFLLSAEGGSLSKFNFFEAEDKLQGGFVWKSTSSIMSSLGEYDPQLGD